jgi:hypothetical protein
MSARARLHAAVAALLLGSAAAAPDADCTRSEPAPLFAGTSPQVQRHTFQAVSPHDAVERFRIDGGIDVMVKHGGCEYVVVTLQFRGPLPGAGNPYATAARQLRVLRKDGAQIPFQLDAAARTLDAQALRSPRPAFGTEYPVDGDGDAPLQAGVKVDGAHRGARDGRVQVTLFRGPL